MSEQEKVSLSTPSAVPQPGTPDYVPPTEVVPLPSKGRVYPPDFPLAGADRVEIRSMTARDEDILTSRALLKQGKAISTLLRSCLVNKQVDVDQMLIGDRNAIMVAIRITGYGAEYEVKVACPKCEVQSKHQFDLSRLAIKPLGKDPISSGKNEFEFDLPIS